MHGATIKIIIQTVLALDSAYPTLRLNGKELHFAQIIYMLIVTLEINRKLSRKQRYPAGARVGGQCVLCAGGRECVIAELNMLTF
jgi:hypothetical protein